MAATAAPRKRTRSSPVIMGEVVSTSGWMCKCNRFHSANGRQTCGYCAGRAEDKESRMIGGYDVAKATKGR